jgi:hypothetical protein
MLEQERDDRFRSHVIFSFEPQFFEAPILAHQVRGRRVEDRDDPFKGRPMERGFEILDGVELDALRAQQLQRPARISSARVVIQDDLAHVVSPTDAARF